MPWTDIIGIAIMAAGLIWLAFAVIGYWWKVLDLAERIERLEDEAMEINPGWRP